MKFDKWSDAASYAAQNAILKQALAAPDHSLDGLLRLMREGKQSALYLSGTRLDNDFCFGSADLGLLFSTLPEGGAKAGEPGYHPGSTEVYVTFQGSLVLQCLEDGVVREKRSSPDHVVILPPGQCHRVKWDPDRQAASLIAKTNLHAKPGVVRCANCTYFANPVDCPLHRSWRADTNQAPDV